MIRDLKPGNILLSNDLTPKVCDFGLSKLSNDNSKTTKTGQVGSLLYMAPEVLLGKNYNEKSDVYSFAIIMWQLIFDENCIFQYNYGTNQKYSTIMPTQEGETFAHIANQNSLLLVPKLISEGLRLPLPKLPLNPQSQIMKMWIREYFIKDDLNQAKRLSIIRQEDPFEKHLTVLDALFSMVQCSWCEDFYQRPSFSKLAEQLLETRSI
ncbi:predicted protein [Naegleria gruberi]|uniref:Predicted protein n=1 Tax=Naegleria gruberi TaxID=5762 RepID=D2W672_NAEGR|nr:uncharacterized protein NAEGRDRAFT_76915 [Naegleria gruberi]EFC35430.1 predicted protein [Naegleria gruberi]|eukprot:XP_002668174.1 predicted protein [Naegleria gruberi strain NEG-M]